MKKNNFILICSILLFLTGAKYVKADSTSPYDNPVNIALGHSYTWDTAPNYSLCTDADDNIQLTDGILTEEGTLWTQKSAVGWQRHSSATITIDLGTDAPISGFALSTAAGKAAVNFTRSILVAVSTDGTDFYEVGNLVQMADGSLPDQEDGYCNFIYRTTNQRTHGRYVRFTYVAAGAYFFMDELEVYGGTQDYLGINYTGSPVSTNSAASTSRLTTMGSYIRFVNDITKIRKRLEASAIDADKKEFVAGNLDQLSTQAKNLSITDVTSFRAVVPFNNLHQNILACFGQILDFEGFPALSVWHSHRYAWLSLFETPDSSISSLSLRMMQNEYRSEAFNLTNAGQTLLDVTFRLEGLPDCVEVRQLEYVDTREGIVLADALTPVPNLSGNYQITLPSGMTRQIWLTFNPRNTGEANYSGNIKIDAGDIHKTLPMALHISSSCFPDQATLNAGVFDYAVANSYGINENNREKVIADLRDHFVNVAFGKLEQAAVPKSSDVDQGGHITKPLDFSAFDKWVQEWPDAKHYILFLRVSTANNKFAGKDGGTAAFYQAVKEWATAWDDHIKDLNFPKGKVIMHFLDEPHTPEQFQILKAWVEAFKSGSTQVEVFNDPVYLDKNDNMNYAPAALYKVDVLCPAANEMLTYPTPIQDFFDAHVEYGTDLWLYMCKPNKHVDPAYFRAQPWYAFQMGATGSFFWNYSDSRGNPWNEYTATDASYSIVYLDDNGSVSTRHWEAFREGIEDYEYLNMLSPDLAEQIVEDALDSLETVTLRKLDTQWSSTNPNSFVDEGRLKTLEKIEQLTSSIDYKRKEQNDFLIFPNPGNGLISVQSAVNFTDGRVEVINTEGRVILNTRLNGNTENLDLTGVKSGVYLIRIRSNNSVATKKMIIK